MPWAGASTGRLRPFEFDGGGLLFQELSRSYCVLSASGSDSRRTLGEQNRQTAATWRNLAIACHSAKQYRDAQTAFARGIHPFEISARPGSLDLLDCLKRNAEVLRKLDRFAEVEQTEVRATRIEVENAIRRGKHS